MLYRISPRITQCDSRFINLTRILSRSFRNEGIGRNEEPILDSSINTMEHVLTILHNAHGSKVETRESMLDMFDSDPESFGARLLASLGDDVFNLRTINILTRLQLQNGIEIFKDSNPNHTKTILSRYISVFKDQYTRDPQSLSMVDIGRAYKQSTQKINTVLDNKIQRTALEAMGDIPTSNAEPAIEFNFCRVNLYNPFRNGTTDPFALRKGLSTKRHPTNIFSSMLNDHEVIRSFLRDFRDRVSPIVMQNIMITQSLSGNLAFKIALKRALVDEDPRTMLDTPFEFYHLGIPHKGNGVKELKTIIAGRSMILKRLEWFPPYKRALASLEYQKYDSNEKVIAIMSDLFDRFFGVCYKTDAKYCSDWTKGLLDFYCRNEGQERFFNRQLEDSISDFRTMVSKSSFGSFSARWLKNDSQNRVAPPKDNSHKTRELLREVRAVMHNSKTGSDKRS